MRISSAVISFLSVIAISMPALSAQRDWNDCLGDSPQAALGGCTRIIQAAREASRNRASAYHNRGLAYAALGDPDRAIADFSAAIRLEPGDPDNFISRGSAYSAKGDSSRAIANFDEALRIDPINARAYFNRALMNFYAGASPAALDDLYQVRELDPAYPYAALWLNIVERRSNVRSRLSQAVSQIDMANWPGPVIRLFMGEITPADALAAAKDPDADRQAAQVCEANFYSGELALAQGDQQEALRLFRFSASQCPKTFSEWMAANAELRTLGVKSASRGTSSRTVR
jgi:lipoprotein NlpI